MKLYNTLSRQIEDVKLIAPPSVSIYTCGPTVYDHTHIGHWFTYVRMDILIRTLKGNGFRPNWVMNITDVGHLTSDADEGQDKLEKSAQKEGKSAWDIAKYYSAEFQEGLNELNIVKPDHMPRATDHLDDQIALIKVLENKGYTYLIDDGVYYDTTKFPDYANFGRLDIDEQQPGKRVEFNPQKKNPTDFALWKFSPTDQKRDMEWDSPWGKGFPGWHIECSAMVLKYLGETIDFHCGGIDHIPVHHTNEIAQSQAANSKPLANYWLHSNHISVDGQKISKSLGNSITLDDLKSRGFSAEDLRVLILESHYQTQSKFSWDNLAAAKQRLSELRAMAVLRYQAKDHSLDYATFALSDVPKEVLNILNDNLNTPEVMAYLSDISTQLLAVGIEEDMVDHYDQMLKDIDNLLGLKLSETPDIGDEIKALISKREKCREQEDWQEADSLREQLRTLNVSIEDKPNGPQWRWLSPDE